MNGDFTRFTTPSTHQTGAGKGNLKEKDRFSQAFSVLLNYWELKPAQYEAKLHEFALKDVRVVSAFVPWAHLETDIYHSLKKFVKGAYVAKLGVRLFVMPELGVNYPNAGVPKDLIASIPNLAVDRLGRVIYSHAAPNIFPLPSFSSPEVLKRFGNFLIKLGGVLGEVFAEVGTSDFCEIVVSNSLFNYYRGHGMPFGEHGDYSAAHVMAFRDFVDREYSTERSAQAAAASAGALGLGAPAPGQSGSAGEQFKTQIHDAYNRHRFFTHVEKLLREKTDMVFSRKSSTCAVRHVDLYNPECEPDAAYQGLLTEIFDFRPSVQRYYESIVSGGYRGEAICLGNSGAFRRFTDQEKSFLMLASIIHAGEVGVMAEELFRLSANFQRKLRAMLAFLDENRLVRQTSVTYVAASKFSMEERSFSNLAGMAPGVLSVAPGIASRARAHSERLVFVDPKTVIRLVELAQSLALAQSGKVVAIPAPMPNVANYSADAMAHLERFRKGRSPLRLNLGIGYEVYEYHLGQVVFYDPQTFWSGEPQPELARFFSALLGLSEVRSLCSVSVADPVGGQTSGRLHTASWISEDDPSFRLLFLINPTDKDLDARLTFSDAVTIKGIPLGGAPRGASLRPDTEGADGGDEIAAPLTGRTFELSVPHYGVLSMQVSDAAQTEIDDSSLGQSTRGEPIWT